MTGTDIAIVISACGTFITTLTAAYGVIVSRRNSAVLEHVRTQTDGLSTALGNAKLAQGTAEGTAIGLQQGRDEVKP
jgi:hypothetical protein